ncbi:MAG: metal-dependent hydrolase [Nitrospinota bacterium]
MDPITHVVSGLILGSALSARGPRGPRPPGRSESAHFVRAPVGKGGLREWGFRPGPRGPLAWAALLGAIVPDADNVVRFWGGLPAVMAYHRGITHSFFGGLGEALVVAGIVRLFARRVPFGSLYLVAYLGVVLHILLDLPTSYGTQAFLPFIARRFALDWVFIIDISLTLCFLLPLLAGLAFPRWGRPLAWGGLVAAALYVGASGLEHGRALAQLRRATAASGIATFEESVLPAPGALFRWLGLTPPGYVPWRGLARIEGGYLRAAQVNPSGPPPQVERLENAPVNPFVRRAEEEDLVRLYRWFARYPLVRYREEGGRHRVEYLDLRFVVDPRRRHFVLVVELTSAGKVARAGFRPNRPYSFLKNIGSPPPTLRLTP